MATKLKPLLKPTKSYNAVFLPKTMLEIFSFNSAFLSKKLLNAFLQLPHSYNVLMAPRVFFPFPLDQPHLFSKNLFIGFGLIMISFANYLSQPSLFPMLYLSIQLPSSTLQCSLSPTLPILVFLLLLPLPLLLLFTIQQMTSLTTLMIKAKYLTILALKPKTANKVPPN
jgi:hypothetical protein